MISKLEGVVIYYALDLERACSDRKSSGFEDPDD